MKVKTQVEIDRDKMARMCEVIGVWEVAFYDDGKFNGKWTTDSKTPDISDLEGYEDDDKIQIIITRKQMKRYEYDELPEFQGL